jgi:predicted component of type VI protein secretion system
LNKQIFRYQTIKAGRQYAEIYTFEPNVEDTATLMRIAKIAQSRKQFHRAGSPRILGIESLAETLESDDWGLQEDSNEKKLWEMLRGLPEASSSD